MHVPQKRCSYKAKATYCRPRTTETFLRPRRDKAMENLKGTEHKTLLLLRAAWDDLPMEGFAKEVLLVRASRPRNIWAKYHCIVGAAVVTLQPNGSMLVHGQARDMVVLTFATETRTQLGVLPRQWRGACEDTVGWRARIDAGTGNLEAVLLRDYTAFGTPSTHVQLGPLEFVRGWACGRLTSLDAQVSFPPPVPALTEQAPHAGDGAATVKRRRRYKSPPVPALGDQAGSWSVLFWCRASCSNGRWCPWNSMCKTCWSPRLGG